MVTKAFLEVVVRRILALEVVCVANMDRPCDAVRDIEENSRGWNIQKTNAMNQAVNAWKFRSALLQSGKDKSSAGVK